MAKTAARTLLRQALTQARSGTASARSIDFARARIAASYSRSSSTTPILCRSCLLASSPFNIRSFHASSPTSAKNNKKSKNNDASSSSSSSSSSTDSEDGAKHPKPDPSEPLNFADVESRLSKHAEHFRAALKKVNSSGRFDPDVVGSLRVVVDKKSNIAYPLHELAAIVPRGGRTVSLLVHDAEYVKPIMSAVQSSADFNQQPQRDADNELELLLKIEADKPEDVVKRVKAVAHEWRERVQGVRQKRDKVHDSWKKTGEVGPDLKRTADKELQKLIKEALGEIDVAEKTATKAIKA